MLKIRIVALLICCLSVSLPALALGEGGYLLSDSVPKDKPAFKDRIYWGGNVGAQFGNFTFINLSPFVGYRFTPRFSAGPGATYTYFRDKAADFTTSLYGGRVFSRYLITDNLFAHAEYEMLSREIFNLQLKRERIAVHSIFVGGGYRQMLGKKSYMTVTGLWNINESVYSPYQNPVIRIGINSGF